MNNVLLSEEDYQAYPGRDKEGSPTPGVSKDGLEISLEGSEITIVGRRNAGLLSYVRVKNGLGQFTSVVDSSFWFGAATRTLTGTVMFDRFPKQVFIDRTENFIGEIHRARFRSAQVVNVNSCHMLLA